MRILNIYYEDVPPSNSLTPEEIEQICCERVPVDECSEVGRVSDYNGVSQDDIDQNAALEQARADNPGKRIIGVRIEDIGRPGKPCGKMRETWQGRLNCCDEVEPISWDFSRSVEVIADLSFGIVYVTGGAPPYRWKIRGQGMTFDGWNGRDAETQSPFIYVFAGESACGYCPITVTDGCSSVINGVRSTNGSWYRTFQHQGGLIDCPIRGDCAASNHSFDGFGNFTVEKNGWKITQYQAAYDVIAQAYAGILAAREACEAKYATEWAWAYGSMCQTGDDRCETCFDNSEGYVPCYNVGIPLPFHDPAIISNCDRRVFAYVGTLSGGDDYWWYTKAHSTYIVYTYVDQWRC